ncbi:alpha/beta hydrolase [Sandaracinus amylolyticus]|uniref:alpha/beta hydrolase n=1 Tax=Sandaracinus amylolyticus TaxID=927083 RepID=UPI001F33013E|nr:alpha/beta hydrolase [Sandaracinus amylolyticus]UJR78900.1 Alpha/beta hydrolase [Sandaracinus amylolyticus]
MSEIVPRESRFVANGLSHRVLEWDAPDERGAPIVCAHGFLDHAWSFHFVAQHLARAGHRVLAFDWRGHGDTEWIGRGGYYHFEDYLLDLVELAPHLTKGAPHHWLGHSMGGTASAMYAGTRPAGLLTLTLCEGLGPPAIALEAAPDRIAGWLSSVARVRAATPRPMRDLDEAAKRLLTQNADLDPAHARFLAEKGTRVVEGGLAWRFDPMHRTSSPRVFRPESFRALLARIDAPVLVVSTELGFRTADHAERVAAIPHAHEVELAGVGHNMHWRGAAALAEAVLAHTRRTASGSPA